MGSSPPRALFVRTLGSAALDYATLVLIDVRLNGMLSLVALASSLTRSRRIASAHTGGNFFREL